MLRTSLRLERASERGACEYGVSRRIRGSFALMAVVGAVLLASVLGYAMAGCNGMVSIIGSSDQGAGDTSQAVEGSDDLSDIESQVVEEINKVRADPAGYASDYIEPIRKYYQGTILQWPGEIGIQTVEGVSALDECVESLESAQAVGPLVSAEGLTLAARDLAEDQAMTGATGHTGSDGSTLSDRISRYGEWDISAGENIHYGDAVQARTIVIFLLIDDGVPSRGHRDNLLDESFRFVGVAVGPHPTYGNMCVMDFAGGYE